MKWIHNLKHHLCHWHISTHNSDVAINIQVSSWVSVTWWTDFEASCICGHTYLLLKVSFSRNTAAHIYKYLCYKHPALFPDICILSTVTASNNCRALPKILHICMTFSAKIHVHLLTQKSCKLLFYYRRDHDLPTMTRVSFSLLHLSPEGFMHSFVSYAPEFACIDSAKKSIRI